MTVPRDDDPFGGQGTPPTQAAMRADVCMEVRYAPVDEAPVRYARWWSPSAETPLLAGRFDGGVLMVSGFAHGPWREATPEECESYGAQVWPAAMF